MSDPEQDARRVARLALAGVCAACRVCDGARCPSGVPGLGGVGTGESFRANVQALAQVRLNLRTLHHSSCPNTGLDFLGFPLTLPILAAPMAGAAFNLGGAVSEEALVAALLDGAEAVGTLGCTGDGATPEVEEAAWAALAEKPGQVIPFLKPWADAELLPKLDQAARLGVRVLGLDLEGIGFTALTDMGRPVVSRTGPELAALVSAYPFPFILKGIMTPDEARTAVQAGASAIVVSNHGGRVLDHTPGVAEVLPAVAQAVAGRIPVLADGGVRSGADVLKLLALGADAVMVGRPLAVAAVGGGSQAVAAVLARMGAELAQAMRLTGCADLASISPAVLRA